MESGRRIVVYERVSSDDQDLARQAVQRRRAEDDYPDEEIVVLVEKGSASKTSIFDRPVGGQLCDLITAGNIEAVYADEQTRLSRGKDVEWVTFQALCESAGTKIVIDGREIRYDLGGRVTSYLRAVLAREEIEHLSHRVKGGMRVRAEEGFFTGVAPLGYRYGEGVRNGNPTGILIEDPTEAALVRRIYLEYLAGRSQRQIARDLDREGKRTKQGGHWAQPIVRRILANPTYKGIISYKDEHGREAEAQGLHGAIIDLETWEKVRILRESLSRTKGGGRGPMPRGHHLFRHGHLRCGLCGDSMIPRTIRARSKAGQPYEVYLCYSRVRNGPDACSQKPVPRAHVDEAVFHYFEAVSLDVTATREQVAHAHELRVSDVRGLRESAEREHRKARAALDKLDRDYGEMPDERWNRLACKYEAELQRAEREAGLLREEEERVTKEGSPADADEAVLAHLARLRSAVVGRVVDAEGLEAVRAALVSMFESFTLHHRDSEAAATKLLDPDLYLTWSPYYLEPKIRPEAVGGFYDSDYEDEGTISFPEPRRVPLPIGGSSDTQGFVT
jgi:site-specific DNA recombinase